MADKRKLLENIMDDVARAAKFVESARDKAKSAGDNDSVRRLEKNRDDLTDTWKSLGSKGS